MTPIGRSRPRKLHSVDQTDAGWPTNESQKMFEILQGIVLPRDSDHSACSIRILLRRILRRALSWSCLTRSSRRFCEIAFDSHALSNVVG